MNPTSAPAYSFSSKTSQNSKSPTPGPSDYNPTNYTLKNHPNFKIVKPSNSHKILQSTPGPSTYNLSANSAYSSSQTIGKSKRSFQVKQDLIPGPGAYETRSLSTEGPRFTFSGKASKLFIKKLQGPGPGEYAENLDQFNSKSRAPAFKIGSEKREKTDRSFGPGPGAYDARFPGKSPNWKFGSEGREEALKSQSPGPGSYEVSGFSSKSYTMLGRSYQSFNNHASPGPGSYNPITIRSKSPYWKLGTSSRSDLGFNKTPSPGPGSYSFKMTGHQSAAIFGTASRSFLTENSPTPGPAEYRTVNLKPSPAFTMRPKTLIQKPAKFETPGPGQYKIEHPKNTGWTLPKEPRVNEPEKTSKFTPGPGQYQDINNRKGPKWVFGSTSREKKTKATTPGPGSYELIETVGNVPKYIRFG